LFQRGGGRGGKLVVKEKGGKQVLSGTVKFQRRKVRRSWTPIQREEKRRGLSTRGKREGDKEPSRTFRGKKG